MPTKQDIFDLLATLEAPDGRKLTEAGVLANIVIQDDKVFFSLSVDAAAVKSWEPVRQKVCLLYTSPSPRDRTRSRMPSSA